MMWRHYAVDGPVLVVFAGERRDWLAVLFVELVDDDGRLGVDFARQLDERLAGQRRRVEAGDDGSVCAKRQYISELITIYDITYEFYCFKFILTTKLYDQIDITRVIARPQWRTSTNWMR